MAEWNFISNHGLVLLFISRYSESTAREVALAIDVTERTVHRILDDLEAEGYISRQRRGRNNVYEVDSSLGLRHVMTRDVVVGDLLGTLGVRVAGGN